MQLFIDTADIEQIRTAHGWGILDGVTTNPSHIARTGRAFEDVLQEIFEVVNGPVSVETVSLDAEGMIREGRAIAAFHRNAVVKVPVTVEGMKAVSALSQDGIRTNVTVCFTPLQAYLAAKSGATYVSPFVHRKELAGDDGIQLIRDVRTVFGQYGYPTKILAASIRTGREVLECLKAGADALTAPFDVLEALYRHPATEAVMHQFLEDWKRVPPAKLFAESAVLK
jgi:transaldolase